MAWERVALNDYSSMMIVKVSPSAFGAKIMDVVDIQNQFNNFKHCRSMQKH